MAISTKHSGFRFRQAGGYPGNSDLSIYYAGTEVTRFTASQFGFSQNAVPVSSDGAALGTTALMWSDLFLASAAVINFNAGNVTITHSAGALAIAGNTTITGTLTSTNTLTSNGNIVAGGSVTAGSMVCNGNFNAGGSVTSGSMVDNGNMNIGGFCAVTGNITSGNTISSSNTTDASSTTTGSLRTAGGAGVAKKLYVGTGVYLASSAVLELTGGAKATITSTGAYTSPPFVVTRTFVTDDFDQTYHAAARVNLDLTNDVPAAKYASAFNIRIIGAADVASTGQLYGLWVDSAGTAGAIGGTFHMARFSVQASAAIPTSYLQFQTADPGVTYAFAFVNNSAIPPCTADTGTIPSTSIFKIAVDCNGTPGYIPVVVDY